MGFLAKLLRRKTLTAETQQVKKGPSDYFTSLPRQKPHSPILMDFFSIPYQSLQDSNDYGDMHTLTVVNSQSEVVSPDVEVAPTPVNHNNIAQTELNPTPSITGIEPKSNIAPADKFNLAHSDGDQHSDESESVPKMSFPEKLNPLPTPPALIEVSDPWKLTGFRKWLHDGENRTDSIGLRPEMIRKVRKRRKSAADSMTDADNLLHREFRPKKSILKFFGFGKQKDDELVGHDLVDQPIFELEDNGDQGIQRSLSDPNSRNVANLVAPSRYHSLPRLASKFVWNPVCWFKQQKSYGTEYPPDLLEPCSADRLNPETEKKVYALSHQKLNERRPIAEQVLISNLMMHILSVHADVTIRGRGPRTRRRRRIRPIAKPTKMAQGSAYTDLIVTKPKHGDSDGSSSSEEEEPEEAENTWEITEDMLGNEDSDNVPLAMLHQYFV